MSYDLTIKSAENYSLFTSKAKLDLFLTQLPGVKRNGDRGFVLDDPPERRMEIDLEVVNEEGDNIEEDGKAYGDINCVRLHIPYAFLGDAIDRDYLPTAFAIADYTGWALYDDQSDEAVPRDGESPRRDPQPQRSIHIDRRELVGYWITWPYSFGDNRMEFHLLQDGRFEGTMFHPGGSVSANTKGTWDVVGEALQWTYLSCKGFPRPRRPERDKILRVEENRFVLLGSCGVPGEHWRGVPCGDVSTNLALGEVRAFLERLVSFVEAGFTPHEIASLLENIQNLQPKPRLQTVLPIRFGGAACPFYLGISLGGLERCTICFSGPVEMIRQITNEIAKANPNQPG
jgi:hypothetical protein